MNDELDYDIHIGMSDELQAMIEGYAAYSKQTFGLTLLELLLSAVIELLDPWDRLSRPLTELLPPERYKQVMGLMADLHGVSEEVIAGNILSRYIEVTKLELAVKQMVTGLRGPRDGNTRPGTKEGRA